MKTKDQIIFSIVVFLFWSTAFGQSEKNTMLFVIDSIPILTDPEEWNPIMQEDIADARIIYNKDTLKLLGYDHAEGVTYIFTKEYRSRADSLKLIPGLKQMEINNGVWNLHKIPYSGKYIDYFNSGKIEDEGTLLNGKLNGELVIYFKNGKKKSVSNYKDGILEGVWNNFYTNGALLQTREYLQGRETENSKTYFINGQIQSEIKTKKDTHYDTAFSYYSTGSIKDIKLIKNHEVVLSKKDEDINYYTNYLNQNLNIGNIKEANKFFYKLWQIDSSSIETYFLEGLIRLKELHLDRAMAEFDKVLIIEPMMREALAERALTRIKQIQYLHEKDSPKNQDKTWTLEDIRQIPADELNKICSDIQQAQYIDFSETYVKKIIPELFFYYCNTRRSK